MATPSAERIATRMREIIISRNMNVRDLTSFYTQSPSNQQTIETFNRILGTNFGTPINFYGNNVSRNEIEVRCANVLRRNITKSEAHERINNPNSLPANVTTDHIYFQDAIITTASCVKEDFVTTTITISYAGYNFVFIHAIDSQ